MVWCKAERSALDSRVYVTDRWTDRHYRSKCCAQQLQNYRHRPLRFEFHDPTIVRRANLFVLRLIIIKVQTAVSDVWLLLRRSVYVWQYKMQFAETFTSWMTRHPAVYRVYQLIDVVERAAPICRLLETEQRVLVCVECVSLL